jgi:PAS domain S-box-containing protein
MLDLYINNTEEAMKRHIEMLDALFKHATEGILVVDSEGTIVMVNPTVLAMFGYTEEGLVGAKIEVLIPKRHANVHVRSRIGYSQGPQARSMGLSRDLYATRSDGSEFPVEVSLSPFSTSEGNFVVSFIIDITERKKQADAIIEAKRQIQELNAHLENRVEQRTRQLEAALQKLRDTQEEVLRTLEKERELNDMKSKFVTIASHEFRTPLATILSSASLIGRYTLGEEDEKRQKHVARIKSAVSNLTEILNDFLSIGKLEEGKVQTVPVLMHLPTFCQELLEDIRGICKEGQTIHYQHQGDGEVWLDKQIVRNILLNLLSNASKYSGSNKEIQLRTYNEGHSIRLEVEDHGIGIPQKDQAHIFERFFRAQNAENAQGTGLGLNIVKKYVTLLGGTIHFESRFGEGSTFKVHLPHKMP